MRDLYEILGVQKNCKPSTIKKAFRELAKVLHPDHGGNATQFEELNTAYHVLSDPDRRRVYDETGYIEESRVQTVEEEALGLVSNVLSSQVDKYGSWLPYIDILAEMRTSISNMKNNCRHDKEREAVKGQTLMSTAENVQTKNPENLIREILEKLAEGPESTVHSAERFLRVADKALEIIKGYNYKPLPMTEEQQKAFQHFLKPKNPFVSLFGGPEGPEGEPEEG